MSQIAPAKGSAPHIYRFGLTEQQVFRLWTAAIKDSYELSDETIHKVYDAMMSFDRDRAEMVMSFFIRRHRDAGRALKCFLDDIRNCSIANPPKLRAA